MKEYKTIEVHSGNGRFVDVKVSVEDYAYLSQWTGWQLNHPRGYVRRTIRKPDGKYGSVYMHRLLANAPEYIEVDHINGDRLDNRRCNLRLSTRSDNLLNKRKPSTRSTVGLIGVEAHRDKFVARIKIRGKRIYIGVFETAEAASRAYQQYKIGNVISYREAIEAERMFG